MEKTPQEGPAALLSVPRNTGRVSKSMASYSAGIALGTDSRNVSSSRNNKGIKRKWNHFDGPVNLKAGFPLVSGLNLSSSSPCTTVSCGKEMEEESSLALGLDISQYQGKTRTGTVNLRNTSVGGPKAFEVTLPKVDLELSLSTGPAESELTTVSQGSSPYQNNLETSAATVQLVDDGSTSSRWRTGPLVPQLQASSGVLYDQVKGSMNAIPLPPTPVAKSPLPWPVISSAEVMPESPAATTSGVNHTKKRRYTSVKTCQFKGCTRGARGASGLCIAHGGGRRCQRAGCQKGAEGKTVFCKTHGGGRRCEYLGCTKSAEGRTDYCIGHGGGRRCSYENCTRAARGKSGLCIRHGGGKRCTTENCMKSAEGISGLCISHGGGRRCQYPACTKGAQGSTIFCKAHGGGKRCMFLGCTKGAEGRTPFCKGHGGGKRCTFEGCPKSVHGGTSFCVSHGGGKRCAMPKCTKSARGRTDFCVRHGGGKRCKFEGCTKSAQGSTDFCKAHGGGKRCSWGQLGLESGGEAVIPCDKFARGKSGLCATHCAQVQEKQIYGSEIVNPLLPEQQLNTSVKLRGASADGNNVSYGCMVASGRRYESISVPNPQHDNSLVSGICANHLSLPEGRVHGGSLMAMLKGKVDIGASNNN